MPHAQRGNVQVAAVIINKNKVTLASAGKTIDAEIESAARDHLNALALLGMGLLTETAAICHTLQESFTRAAAIRIPDGQAAGAQPKRPATPPASVQPRRPRV